MACSDPECREELMLDIKGRVSYKDFNELKACVGTKVGKKAVWSGFVALIAVLSLLAGVWSQQGTNLPSSNKDAISDCKESQIGMDAALTYLSKSVDDLKAIVKNGQTEFRKDIREILKRLPKE